MTTTALHIRSGLISGRNGFRGDHLYFIYDDYGYVEEEPDPLKKAVNEKFGSPGTKGATYLIKVKLDVK